MLMNFFQVFKKYLLVYDQTQGSSALFALLYTDTSLNPVPNAQVRVCLMVHITKLQLQTTFPKPLYIPNF
jgi:hypothetical protein